jgi:calcineurin-like phosphoesterase family protein
MNETMIKNWNDTVGKKDYIYHVGDLFLTTDVQQIDTILERLNGSIKLIRGNHDKWVSKLQNLRNCKKIESVKDYDERSFIVNNEKINIVLMHYPMRTWNKSHYGSFQLHGHCHGSMDIENKSFRRLDVGVDAMYSNYTPIHLERIIRELSDRPLAYHHNQDKE